MRRWIHLQECGKPEGLLHSTRVPECGWQGRKELKGAWRGHGGWRLQSRDLGD